MQTPTSRGGLLSVLAAVTLVLVGCAESSPEVPNGPDGDPDAVLVAGRDVFGSRCSNCHGSAGGGGTGPRLAGRVEDIYADIADQIQVVREGRKNMPTFGGTLSDEEIEAVVRYTREVLG